VAVEILRLAKNRHDDLVGAASHGRNA